MTTLIRPRRSAEEPAVPMPEPVTVTVARVVRPDRREAFERWADDALAKAGPPFHFVPGR